MKKALNQYILLFGGTATLSVNFLTTNLMMKRQSVIRKFISGIMKTTNL